MKRNKIGILALIICMACSLVACGGSKKPSTNNDFNFEVDPDFGSGQTGNKVEVVVEDSYVHTGSVSYDMNGTASAWHQYEYDESGNLIKERVYISYSDGYTEYIYSEDGLLESVMSCDAEGTADSGLTYTYEKDAKGRVVSESCMQLNETEPINTKVYTYTEAGVLEKATEYNALGRRIGVILYDKNGNESASYSFMEEGEGFDELFSYEGEKVGAYSYYTYDANGDLIEMRYANLMEPYEIVITYVNAYDDEGNLIFVNGYNWVGDLISQDVKAYAEASTDYTATDIEKQAEEIKERYYQCTVKEEKHFALLKEKIENDETVFTFGYFSNRYMEFKGVALDKFAWDEKGRYCDLDLTYVTDAGEKTYSGQIYYIIDGAGDVVITDCVTETPEGEFAAPGDNAVLWSADYYTVAGIQRDEILYDESSYYAFRQNQEDYIVQEYIGKVQLCTGKQPNVYVLRNGSFTVDPDEKFDFILKICWDNGEVEKYYCESLMDDYGYVIRINVYDEVNNKILSSSTLAVKDMPNYVKEAFINAD